MNKGERRISRFEVSLRDAFIKEANEKGLTLQEVFIQFMNTEVYGPENYNAWKEFATKFPDEFPIIPEPRNYTDENGNAID